MKDMTRTEKPLKEILSEKFQYLESLLRPGTPVESLHEAILEAGKEYYKRMALNESKQVNAQALACYYRAMTDKEGVEQVALVYLDSRLRVIALEVIGKGSIDSAPINRRLVLDGIVKHKARSVILMHNDISGSPEFSEADKKTTRLLYYALASFSINLVDHIVIGNQTGAWVSAYENGDILKFEKEFESKIKSLIF